MTGRAPWTIVLLVTVVLRGRAADQPRQPTFRHYIKHAAGPGALARAAAGAGITQATNTPHEWGQGAAGFGKRLGSAFGKHLVHKSIEYPVARLLHEELGYRRSTQHGFRRRLRYALLATIITHKTTTGKKTVAVDEIAGAFGSGLISRLWQPASVRALSYGFLSGGITLGVDAGTNVLREFWPEIRHPRSHKQQATFRNPPSNRRRGRRES